MTKNDTHIIDEVLAHIREAWIKTPELRFGQFIANVIGPNIPCPKIYYIKDKDLRGRLTEWTTENSEIKKTDK